MLMGYLRESKPVNAIHMANDKPSSVPSLVGLPTVSYWKASYLVSLSQAEPGLVLIIL